TFDLPPIRMLPAPTLTATSASWSVPDASLTANDRLELHAVGSEPETRMRADISAGWASGAPRELRFDEMAALPGWDPAWALGGWVVWTATVDHTAGDVESLSGTQGVLMLDGAVAPPTRADTEAAERALALA